MRRFRVTWTIALEVSARSPEEAAQKLRESYVDDQMDLLDAVETTFFEQDPDKIVELDEHGDALS